MSRFIIEALSCTDCGAEMKTVFATCQLCFNVFCDDCLDHEWYIDSGETVCLVCAEHERKLARIELEEWPEQVGETR